MASQKNLNWDDVAPHPSNILATGGRGEGKTALAGTYIDYCKSQGVQCFTVGRKLPHCKNVQSSFLPPSNSLLVVDDAHLQDLYAHENTKVQKVYDFLQRQKRHNTHSIFYTTQDTTGFSVRLIRLLDAVCIFKPDMMTLEYERSKMAVKYREAVKALPVGDTKGKVWVQYQDEHKEIHQEVKTFSLPSWWTDDISTGHNIEKEGRKPFKENPILEGFRMIGRLFG